MIALRASAAAARSPSGPSCGVLTPALGRSAGNLAAMVSSARDAEREARAPASAPGSDLVIQIRTMPRAIRDRYHVPPAAAAALRATWPTDSSSSKRPISSGVTSVRLSASIRTATCQPARGTPSCLARSSMSWFSADSEISSSARSSERDRIGSSRAFASSSASRAAASAAARSTSRAATARSPCASGATSLVAAGGSADCSGSTGLPRPPPTIAHNVSRSAAACSARSTASRPALALARASPGPPPTSASTANKSPVSSSCAGIEISATPARRAMSTAVSGGRQRSSANAATAPTARRAAHRSAMSKR